MSRAVDVNEKLSPGRDYRLDFWRGLCLVDMVLVHLVYEGVRMGRVLEPVLGEFVRFAAGGFIFLAGLGVSYIFLPKVTDENRRWSTYTSLWRRSLYLLFVHYAASLSFIFIYPLRDFAGPYPGPVAYVKDVLLFREGSDLLLFYVIMVAVSPAILEVMRRGYAWLVAVLSVGLFGAGHLNPHVLSLPIQQNFMVVLWQMMFVTGMLAGTILPKWDALTLRGKVKGLACAVAALAVVETLYLTPLGWHLGVSFVKNPLSWGEAARYLALIVTIMMATDLAWRFIADGGVSRFLTRLGRRSLAVYVAHVWVVAIVIAIARRTEWLGAWQFVLAVVAVAMLWVWTCVLDLLSEAPKKRGEEASLIGPAFWRVSGAAVAGVAFLFSIHAAMPLWNRDPVTRMLAKAAPPANLVDEIASADDDAYDPEVVPTPDLPFFDDSADDAA